MIEVRLVITEDLAQKLEDHFCEEYQEHWMLHEDTKTLEHQLRGFFDTESTFEQEQAKLLDHFPALPMEWMKKELEDSDWKEAYKLHFKPWAERGLHWVPIWEKENYSLPEGEQIVYLDPGMAFGTGNHETTRLCARRLLDAYEDWKPNIGNLQLIDAGCGSGILAISGQKLGFGKVIGFDNDPDSVRISLENEKLCEVENQIEFKWADLVEGLKEKSADLLLVNILANVLCDHAELLVESVNPGGRLALSGILASELDDVHQVFAHVIEKQWGIVVEKDAHQEGDWGDLLYKRP